MRDHRAAPDLVSVIVLRDRAGSVGPCNFKPLRKYVEEGSPTGCYQEQSKRTRYHLRGNYQTKPNNAYGSRIFSEALDGNRSRGARSSVLFASDEQRSAVQEAESTLGVKPSAFGEDRKPDQREITKRSQIILYSRAVLIFSIANESKDRLPMNAKSPAKSSSGCCRLDVAGETRIH
jgi:hypothetical protein